VRYEVYTLRHTAARTVYAVYDAFASQPVCVPGTNRPITTTDRSLACSWARKWEKEGAAA
jgi:hypothetical protein